MTAATAKVAVTKKSDRLLTAYLRNYADSSGLAGSRTPLRSVGLPFELLAGHEAFAEILRIIDNTGDDQVRDAVRINTIEVLEQAGILAVRNAVFAQVARAHMRRYHLYVSTF